MFITRLALRNLFLLYLIGIILGCTSAKPVSFEDYVDTTNKPIEFQNKKTFSLEGLDIYASNEFDGARLNGFQKLNDSTALVIINPENQPINNSPYYAFETWAGEDRPFYYTFQYPKGFKHRYVPKLKTDENWAVVDSTDVMLHDSRVTIRINLSQKPVTVAAQEIQSSSDVEKWYLNLINGKGAFVKYETYGKSGLGRNLAVLNISKSETKGKDVIILLTRQHPPEVTGYYAFQNFLETILSNSGLSNDFLNQYHVLAFPLMNPDGVDLGHWRHNSGGVDTNRDWSVYNQREINQTVKYIQKVLRKNGSKIILGLDFHSTWHDVFYTNVDREYTALPNFIENWFDALENNIPNYKVNEESSNSKRPVSKGWFLYGHNAVGITYEIGDATPEDEIKRIGRISAEQMMNILTQSNIN